MKNLLRLVRWHNLLIVGIVMGISSFEMYIIHKEKLEVLGPNYFSFVVAMILAVIFSTAAGFLDNNIKDISNDIVNAPTRTEAIFKLGVETLKTVTIVLYLLGILIPLFWVKWFGAHYSVFALSVVSIANLYAYNRYWKCTAWAGNLAVALMIMAAVLYIPAAVLGSEVWNSKAVIWFVVFAGISTLIRELIKDLEDKEGDMKAGCYTTASRYPWNILRMYWLLLNIILICMVIYRTYLHPNWWISSFGLVMAVFFLFGLPSKNEPSKEALHKKSNYWKFLMILGIGIWLLSILLQ
jgi:4-hydroxybenzoate polyprenyltransferase